MRSFVAAAIVALVACTRDASAPAPAPAPAAAPASATATATATAPTRAPTLHAWTSSTTMRQPPHKVPDGVSHVTVHVPEGFDASAPLHLVIYFHGAMQCAELIAKLGPVVCKKGGPAWSGYGFDDLHDLAGTNTIFVVPQFAYFGGGDPGRMREPGYFRSFVEELVKDTLAPGLGGARTLDDVASITLIAHSAGWWPVQAIVANADLDDKVKSVVMLDAMFDGSIAPYARFLERDPAHRFAYVYSPWGDTGQRGRSLAERTRKVRPRDVAIDPDEGLANALRDHPFVLAKSDIDHYWMPGIVLTKIVEGLPVPRRAEEPLLASGPPPKAASARAIALGETASAKLDASGIALPSRGVANDYAVMLHAGDRVAVTVRGGRSETESCCKLDVMTIAYDAAGRELARDDDSAPRGARESVTFDSLVRFTAAADGTYFVRVTTHGPWLKTGVYSVGVERD